MANGTFIISRVLDSVLSSDSRENRLEDEKILYTILNATEVFTCSLKRMTHFFFVFFFLSRFFPPLYTYRNLCSQNQVIHDLMIYNDAQFSLFSNSQHEDNIEKENYYVFKAL